MAKELRDSQGRQIPGAALWVLALLLLFAAILPMPAASAAESRTWRNSDGKKLDAVFVGVEGEDALLSKPGAPEVVLKYPIKSLSEKDREFVEAWRANHESVIGQLLWGKLVKAKPDKTKAKPKKGKKGEPAPAEDPPEEAPTDPAELFTKIEDIPSTRIKYYVLYFSGKWSPYDRAFTPKLVEYYQDKRPKNSKSTEGAGLTWDVFLISADRGPADLAAYMNQFSMPWPAMEYEAGLKSPLVRYRGPGLPCLVVVDPEGKVLIDTFKGRDYRGPDAALEDLKKLIDGGPDALKKSSDDDGA